jgi:hypothetical protein
MMVFEETTKSLFPAYLYLQPDDQPAIVRENLGKGMCRWYRESDIFAAEEPARRVDRIQELDPHWVHPMHGGSLPKDVLPAYTRALKSEAFAYDGRVFGRTILG